MHHRLTRSLWTLLAAALLSSAASAASPVGYYRFPAIHGDTLVFVAEGDLWRVAASGGVAQRLTTHLSEERYPAFSADGTVLAFSATYEGPEEVYTMPLAGGLPTRRSWEGEAARVVGWAGTSAMPLC